MPTDGFSQLRYQFLSLFPFPSFDTLILLHLLFFVRFFSLHLLMMYIVSDNGSVALLCWMGFCKTNKHIGGLIKPSPSDHFVHDLVIITVSQCLVVIYPAQEIKRWYLKMPFIKIPAIATRHLANVGPMYLKAPGQLQFPDVRPLLKNVR